MNPIPPPLDRLLVPHLPSELRRVDEALEAEGVSGEELRGTRDAMAAIGLLSSPLEPSSSLRERIVASASRDGKYGQFTDRIARLFDIDTAAAERLLQRIEAPEAWSEQLLDGVHVLSVDTGPNRRACTATIVKIAPGASFPFHRHLGEETMVMLDGGFRDPTSPTGQPHEGWYGDELLQADGTGHALMAIGSAPCIAAVLIEGHSEYGMPPGPHGDAM